MTLIQRLLWLPAMLRFGLMWEMARPAFVANRKSRLLERAKWVVAAQRNGGYWSDMVEQSRYTHPQGPNGPTVRTYWMHTRWVWM